MMQALGFHSNDHFQYRVITVQKIVQKQKSVSHLHMICSTKAKTRFP